jgi:hypothetical protein
MGILSFNVCLFSPESFVNWRDVAKRVMYRLQKAWTDEQIGVCSCIVPAFLFNVIFRWLVPLKNVLEILECSKSKGWIRLKDLPLVLV